MANTVSPELAQSVSDWILLQANAMHTGAAVYSECIVRAGNWLNIPVWIDYEGDAYDRASLLQGIEDLWEPADHDGLQIFLMPAKPKVSSDTNLYAQITNLMDRQHEILNSIDPDSVDVETAKQLIAVRQEWVETRNEAKRVLTAAPNS